jgi:hypothetical protein
MKKIRALAALGLALGLIAVACGGDNTASGPINTGQSCTTAAECFGGVDGGAIIGTAICLDKVPGGYCTHSCTADTDCCAVPGECPSGQPEVCGPFESTGQMDCFLSCEDAVLKGTGYTDSSAYCAHYASPTFICRSTGGGSNNRKVCVPS